MRILVVEDEQSLGRLLELELAHAGFDVHWATRGDQALDQLQQKAFDCVILDVMLPDLSGMEICRRIRQNSDIGVIMVTARGQTLDMVSGLDVGADDYLVKPVNMEELAARIRAVVRRRAGASPEGRILNAKDVTIFRDQHRVEASGQPVTLSPLEYQLLEYLLIHKDWVQTRTHLLEHIWGFDFSGDTNIVDVTVSRLRRKLGAHGSQLEIETIRGFGYVVRSTP